MAQQSFSNWAGADPTNPAAPYTTIGMGPEPVFRSSKDRMLSGYRSSPDAVYPDGYLGTIDANRRQDKILSGIQKQTSRQYSRGVHKGERINAQDYLWPKEFNLTTGLELEAKGKKFAPMGMEPSRLVNDGKQGAQVAPPDPARRSQLSSLKPSWR